MTDFGYGTMGGIASGVGTVAGAAISASANSAAAAGANATNLQMNTDNNNTNLTLAADANAYNTMMSDTAYQRQTADMKAAGLNPILAAGTGGGASTPNAVVIPEKAGTVQPVVTDFGKAVSALGGTASTILNAQRDLDQKDANIAASKATALASVASAQNMQTNSAATMAKMPSIMEASRAAHTEADAEISRAQADQVQSQIDKKMAPYDAVTSRVLQAIGGISSAVGIGSAVQKINNSQRDQTIKEEQHLKNQGLSGTELQ